MAARIGFRSTWIAHARMEVSEIPFVLEESGPVQWSSLFARRAKYRNLQNFSCSLFLPRARSAGSKTVFHKSALASVQCGAGRTNIV